MRTNLAFGAVISRVLAAFTLLTAGHRAGGQEFPSLSGAVASGGEQAWSTADPGGTIVGPSLTNEYLAPIAADENDPLAKGFSGESCNTCNGEGVAGIRSFYNRCGCDTQLFPWFTGPGNCDNWCVGPHWNVEVDGMFIHRDDAEWGDVGATPVQQFDYGPGVRIFATGYNYSNYGVQIGYEGVNDFHSSGFTGDEDITYESTLNSLEVNLMRRRNVPLKLFVGGRYIEIDEDYVANTVNASGGGDIGDVDGTLIENRLMGAQVGFQRDAWQLNRWVTIEPYGNAGAYFNDFKREDVTFDAAGNSLTLQKNEFDEIAFVGEAGVTSILRINTCLALRGGYQVMAFHNVGNALETSVLPRGFDADTLIYHGARFGIEYQR